MTVGGRLVVVGDALLDVDVEGSAERLAPDGPVPVVDVDDVRRRPGGARWRPCWPSTTVRSRWLALGGDRAGGSWRRRSGRLG